MNMSKYGRFYSKKEDIIIVNFIKDHVVFLKGDSVWKRLITETGLNRTWMSVKNRFKRNILPHLTNKSMFPNITDEEVQNILKSYHTIKSQNKKHKNISSASSQSSSLSISVNSNCDIDINEDENQEEISKKNIENDKSSTSKDKNNGETLSEHSSSDTIDIRKKNYSLQKNSSYEVEIDHVLSPCNQFLIIKNETENSSQSVQKEYKKTNLSVNSNSTKIMENRSDNNDSFDLSLDDTIFSHSTVKINENEFETKLNNFSLIKDNSISETIKKVESSDSNSVAVCFSSDEETIKHGLIDDDLDAIEHELISDETQNMTEESFVNIFSKKNVSSVDENKSYNTSSYECCCKCVYSSNVQIVKQENEDDESIEREYSQTLIVDNNFSTRVIKHHKLSENWKKRFKKKTNIKEHATIIDYINLVSSNSSESSFEDFKKNVSKTSSIIKKNHHYKKKAKGSKKKAKAPITEISSSSSSSSDNSTVFNVFINKNSNDERTYVKPSISKSKNTFTKKASNIKSNSVSDSLRNNLQGSKTKNTSKNTSKSLNDNQNVKDFFSDSMDEIALYKIKNKSVGKSLPYTLKEDLMIINFIVKKQLTLLENVKIYGYCVWKEMTYKKKTDRTHQSLKNRFLRHILCNLDSYNLPPKTLKILKRFI